MATHHTPSTDSFVPTVTSLPTDDVANTGIVSTCGTISHDHIAGFVNTDISLTTNIVQTDIIIDNDVGDANMPTSKIKVVSDISSVSSDSVYNLTNTDRDFTVPPGFLHKFMESIQLRQDEFASVINLRDCSLTKPQLCVLSKGLNFSPLPSSVDRLSLRESIANLSIV